MIVKDSEWWLVSEANSLAELGLGVTTHSRVNVRAANIEEVGNGELTIGVAGVVLSDTIYPF